jgi:hypothetical protein
MGDCLCLFCKSRIEDREHIFFQCGFSKCIWKNLMNLCLEGCHFETWESIVHWCLSDLRKDCFKTRLHILCLGAAVYNLWKRDLIHALHHHNKCTTTPHMRMGPSVWSPPSCEGLLCTCCVGVVNLIFSLLQLPCV